MTINFQISTIIVYRYEDGNDTDKKIYIRTMIVDYLQPWYQP